MSEDLFNQLDEKWWATMQRWYAHKKSLSPKLHNVAVMRKQLEYLLELSEGEVMTREQLLPYWDFFVSLDRLRTPNFKCDNDNAFTFSNLIRWVLPTLRAKP